MEQYQICSLHQEKVEFISRDTNNNKLLGNCLKCLPFPSGVPYQSIQNVQTNIDNNKVLMIKHFEEQKVHNITIVKKLIEYLNQYKKSQVENLEKVINQGKSEIQQIEKKCNHSQNLIKEYTASLDVEELKSLYNNLQYQNTFDKTSQLLLQMLIQISQQPFLLDSYEILQQAPYSLLNVSNTENKFNIKKIYKCPAHNQTLIGINLQNEGNDILCLNCINIENASFTKLDEAENIWNEYHLMSKHHYHNLQNFIQKLVSQIISPVLEKYTNAQRKLDTMLMKLQNYKFTKLQEFTKMMLSQEHCQIDYTSKEILQSLKKISKLSVDDWKQFEFEITKLDSFLDQKPINLRIILSRLNEFINLLTNIQINEVQKTKIQFVQVSSINQDKFCRAISLNSEGNILVAGCNNLINVFQFNCGFLNKIQQLDGHIEDIFCLQFMRNRNIFLSASKDKIIKIWKQEQQNNWKEIQTLLGHTDQIYCLVIHKDCNQIISGGKDQSIRFWSQNNNEWMNSQIISEHEKEIYSLSLNESQSKLISCGGDNLILVMEEMQNNGWSIIQKIKTLFGCRVCFITDDLFSFQPNEGKLQMYKLNNQQNEFTLIKAVEVYKSSQNDNFFFPMKFIKSKQILVIKHNEYLSIIKIDNEEFLVDQCIDFQDKFHYGTISEDGEYLVTWDYRSQQIKVRNRQTIFEPK